MVTATWPSRPSAERVFYLSMVGAIIATMVLGFAQTFLFRPFFPHVVAAREPLFYIHGAIYMSWIALLGVQVGLVSAGNTAAHRRLGVVAVGLIPLMLVIGIYAGLVGAHRPTGFTGVPEPPLHFLGVLYAMIGMFGLYSGLALRWRRNPQTHKRLMLLAALTLAEAGVTRWPFDFMVNAPSEMTAFWVTCLFLAPMAVWDLATLRRLHPVTLWGGLAFIVSGPLREALSSTPAWLAFAKAAVGLLG